MKVLALELSSVRGSIALGSDEEDVFLAEFANDRKHSGLFFENLERCVRQCGQPDRIVVGLGPGSYAGTRIAIASAFGLQAANGSELIGLPSLCAMPTNAAEYAVIGDARRQSFFFARVRDRRCIEGPALYGDAELKEHLKAFAIPIFSAEILQQFPKANLMHPSAAILAKIGANEPASATLLEPIYLREPHITRAKSAIA